MDVNGEDDHDDEADEDEDGDQPGPSNTKKGMARAMCI